MTEAVSPISMVMSSMLAEDICIGIYNILVSDLTVQISKTVDAYIAKAPF